MAKRKTGQVSAGAKEQPQRDLTWREERFIEAYIENGGNGSQAAVEAGYSRHCSRQLASEILTRPYIRDAIEQERERLRQTLRFDREKALKILIGRASASLDDFIEVMRNYKDRESYRGLGAKRFAIKSVKETENGIDFQLHDGLAALNELWEKLGLGKESTAKDWADGLDNVLSIIDRLETNRKV